jgi:acyl carrier protein
MVFEAIAKLIAEHNDCDAADVKMDSSFKEFNIDSLDTVAMIMDLGDELGIEIELDRKILTVGELVAFIAEKYGKS